VANYIASGGDSELLEEEDVQAYLSCMVLACQTGQGGGKYDVCSLDQTVEMYCLECCNHKYNKCVMDEWEDCFDKKKIKDIIACLSTAGIGCGLGLKLCAENCDPFVVVCQTGD
jgi:hypothetical protein